MHHYPHHIGDFNNATRHLTRVERSLYRDLIELYYDAEQPLPADDFDRLARRVMASSEEEKAALKYVLAEFFILDGGVYRNERCDKEIANYLVNVEKKAKAGKASAEARKHKAADEQQVLDGCSTNQSPIPNLQSPPEEPKEKPRNRGSRIPEDWVLSDKQIAWTREKAPTLNVSEEAEKFRDHWQAKAGKDGVKLDWEATWRTWVRNALRFAAPRAGPQRPSSQGGFEQLDYGKGIGEDGRF